MQAEVATRVPAQVRTIVTRVRNEPVLASLRKLSGQSHGFDMAAWSAWWERTGQRLAKEQDEERAQTQPAAPREGKPKKVVRDRKAAAAPTKADGAND